MTVVPAPAKVLVTGASGFLAAHIVSNLLAAGYTVVGTVRSQSKGDYLVNLYENYAGKFSFIVVPDVEKSDAFDEAVKGVDAVLHTASPFHFAADDPNEVIGPAVQGTVGILQSIQKFAPSVKRVVVTSSAASISSPKPAGYVYTEEDWNDVSPATIEKLGSKAPNNEKYRASKSLAERAAWDFVKTNKESIAFDLVTICPPFIYGPPIHEIKDVSALNESVAGFRRALATPPTSQEAATAYMGNFVDVRDVAAAHTRAIQVEEAGGERFLTSAGPFSWQEIYDTLREARVADIPEGFPGTQDRSKYYLQDGSKTTRVLGVKYKTLQETAVDTVNSLRARFPGSC